MPPPSVSVVLPAYQLGRVLDENLRRVLAAVGEIPSAQVVVVDDGSDDDTPSVVAAVAAADPRLEVVTHATNRGKGEALVSGWRASTGDVVVFLDADLDLPPEQVPRLLGLLERADVVVGSKRLAMSQGNYPRFRTFLSRLYAASTSRIFRLPVDETQTGLKLFRRQVLDRVLPEIRLLGYAFDLELLVRAHRLGYTIEETPVELAASARDATFRPAMAWELARDALRMAWWTATDPAFRSGAPRRNPGP